MFLKYDVDLKKRKTMDDSIVSKQKQTGLALTSLLVSVEASQLSDRNSLKYQLFCRKRQPPVIKGFPTTYDKAVPHIETCTPAERRLEGSTS